MKLHVYFSLATDNLKIAKWPLSQKRNQTIECLKCDNILGRLYFLKNGQNWIRVIAMTYPVLATQIEIDTDHNTTPTFLVEYLYLQSGFGDMRFEYALKLTGAQVLTPTS